jgi:hypothetical protein
MDSNETYRVVGVGDDGQRYLMAHGLSQHNAEHTVRMMGSILAFPVVRIEAERLCEDLHDPLEDTRRCTP